MTFESFSNSESNFKSWKTKKSKEIITAALFICFLTNGIGFSILSPTQLDIKQMIGTEIKQLSFGFLSRSGAYAAAALICK